MNKSFALGFSMTASLCLFACGGAPVDPTEGTDVTAPEAKAPTPAPIASVRRVSIGGTTRTLALGGPLDAGAPLAGMTVCSVNPGIACTTTGADGAWSLQDLPANSRPSLVFTPEGQFPSAAAPGARSITFETTTGDIAVPSNETLFADSGAVARLSAKPADPAKGSIVFFATEIGADRSTALEFASGVAVHADGPDGTAPLFLNRSGKPVVGATATAGSWGAFVNVAPGDYKVTFRHPTATCRAVDADSTGTYGFDAEQTITVSVVAGAVSAPIQVFCPYAGGVPE